MWFSMTHDIKYTPAVTEVEEWTKEETGVGAAFNNLSSLY